jgi:hypothetical protein
MDAALAQEALESLSECAAGLVRRVEAKSSARFGPRHVPRFGREGGGQPSTMRRTASFTDTFDRKLIGWFDEKIVSRFLRKCSVRLDALQFARNSNY